MCAQAGITNAALASAAVQMTNVLMTMVAASLMDRAGRKQLLTLSFSGMGLSMLAMAAGLGFKQLSGLSSSVAIVGTVAYVVSFALGAGPVPGLLVPEITPARLRGALTIRHSQSQVQVFHHTCIWTDLVYTECLISLNGAVHVRYHCAVKMQ